MPQKRLDGKTDCKGVKGSCTVRFTGKNPEIMKGLADLKKKYPCVKVRVNGELLKEGVPIDETETKKTDA